MVNSISILTLFVIIFAVQSQRIGQSSGDFCSDEQWKRDVQEQVDAMQKILQNHAVKISKMDYSGEITVTYFSYKHVN